MAMNPFAAAFDAYWNLPTLGQLYTASETALPQLDDLPKIFPDVQNVKVIDAGNQIKFEVPTLGPLGSTVYVCLTSPSMASFATGFTLCMHIYPEVAPYPVCCGLWTSTQGPCINVVVPTDEIKNGPITLERLQAYDKKTA
jgi:hypothetical protein